MNYEYEYERAKQRYNYACSEINRCTNRIYDLKAQERGIINKINQANQKMVEYQQAVDEINRITEIDTVLDQKHTQIVNRTADAAANYKSMITASNVVSKNLTEVYGDELANTKSTISSIFQDLRNERNVLNANIEELKNQIRKSEAQQLAIQREIKRLEQDIVSWKQTKSSAAIDMQYYYKKMQAQYY